MIIKIKNNTNNNEYGNSTDNTRVQGTWWSCKFSVWDEQYRHYSYGAKCVVSRLSTFGEKKFCEENGADKRIVYKNAIYLSFVNMYFAGLGTLAGLVQVFNPLEFRSKMFFNFNLLYMKQKMRVL
jgi:hypothetical protein